MSYTSRTGLHGTFVHARKEQAPSSGWIAYVLAFFGVFCGMVWFIFVSRHWSIVHFQIEGLQQLERGEVEGAAMDALDHGSWKPWDRRNIFFVNTTELEKTLQERLVVERVHVDKVYPNVLRLIIKERQRSVVLATDHRFMLVDLKGVVTGDVSDASLLWVHALLAAKTFADNHHPPVILVGTVGADGSATSASQIVDPMVVRRWINAYHTLLVSQWRFRTFAIDHVTSRTLKIAVQGNFDVIMDMETPLEPQIETFNSFLRSKQKNIVIRDYINVTIPGKVSFK